MNLDEALCATARAMRVIYPCLDSPPHPSEASRGQSWLRSLRGELPKFHGGYEASSRSSHVFSLRFARSSHVC